MRQLSPSGRKCGRPVAFAASRRIGTSPLNAGAAVMAKYEPVGILDGTRRFAPGFATAGQLSARRSARTASTWGNTRGISSAACSMSSSSTPGAALCITSYRYVSRAAGLSGVRNRQPERHGTHTSIRR